MNTPSHEGSCRQAGLRRRLTQARDDIVVLSSVLDSIAVVFPKDYDGDKNVTFRDILRGKVKGAKLSVSGKIMARAKVQELLNKTHDTLGPHYDVAEDVSSKLRALGARNF